MGIDITLVSAYDSDREQSQSLAPGGERMNRLQELRKARNMTQRQVAAAAGCSPALISMLERDVREAPSVYLAQRIARALGVPVEEVFPLSDQEGEQSA